MLGWIDYSDETSAHWMVKWSDVSAFSNRSPVFPLVTGTCCFSIQPKSPPVDRDTYVLKLVNIRSNRGTLRPIRLIIGGSGTICAVSGWTLDEEPRLEFKASDVRRLYGSLRICCEIEKQSLEHSTNRTRSIPLDEETKVDDPSRSRNLPTTGVFIPSAEETKLDDGPKSRNLPTTGVFIPSVEETKVDDGPRSRNLPTTGVFIPSAEETKADDGPRSRSTAKLIGDLKEILISEMDSDVVLKVEDREFKAHRIILRMRSPVFSAMFEHEMREKNSGVVAIEDCDPETFPDFLHYIYTGTVEKLSSENAPLLYVAADKYQLLELKEECLDYMKKNVSAENFCDFMAISLRHHETELTKIATQFFLEKAADVVVTTKWMKFLVENVIAGNELIVKLAGNKETK